MSLLLFRCQVQSWILRLLLLRWLTVSPIDFLCDEQHVLWSSWVSYVSRSRQALPLLLAAAADVLSPRVPSSRCPPTLFIISRFFEVRLRASSRCPPTMWSAQPKWSPNGDDVR